MADTIFVNHTPNTYKAYKTIGGWSIMFLDHQGNSRNVDGGKVYPNRQNAYARVKRLNHPIKHAIKKTGMCEADWDGYIALVIGEDEGFSLHIQQGGMPPHYSKGFKTIEDVEVEMRDHSFFPVDVIWKAINPEDE
jgi:hypothetical protein